MKSSVTDTRNILGIVIVICAVVVGYVWYTNRPSSADHAVSAVVDEPVLKKQWEKFSDNGDNIEVSGEVTNISRNPVAYFQGVTEFVDGKGRILRTNPVVIDRVSLNPGESTKYRTLCPPLPAIQIEVTNFTDVSGIPIPTEKASNAPKDPLKNIPMK